MTTTEIELWISRFLLQTPQLSSSEHTAPNAASAITHFSPSGPVDAVNDSDAPCIYATIRAKSVFPVAGSKPVKHRVPQRCARPMKKPVLPPRRSAYLGKLPAINTSTGFIVEPWLGVLDQLPDLTLQQTEVDSVLLLPLHEALSAERRQTEIWPLRGRRQQFAFYPLAATADLGCQCLKCCISWHSKIAPPALLNTAFLQPTVTFTCREMLRIVVSSTDQ